jgi:hypothetical protein
MEISLERPPPRWPAPKQWQQLRKHVTKLAADLDDMATQYDALAAREEAQAKAK